MSLSLLKKILVIFPYAPYLSNAMFCNIKISLTKKTCLLYQDHSNRLGKYKITVCIVKKKSKSHYENVIVQTIYRARTGLSRLIANASKLSEILAMKLCLVWRVETEKTRPRTASTNTTALEEAKMLAWMKKKLKTTTTRRGFLRTHMSSINYVISPVPLLLRGFILSLRPTSKKTSMPASIPFTSMWSRNSKS